MTGAVEQAFNTAFRDYVVDGSPASGKNPPNKAVVRALGSTIATAIGVNVDSYGAAGDGVTDDTLAFVAAQAVLGPAGGTIFVSAKKYALNYIITGNNISLQGPGGAQVTTPNCKLIPYDGTKPALQIGDGSTATSGIRIRAIKVDGLQTQQYGVKVYGVSDLSFADFVCGACTQKSFWVTSSAGLPSVYIFGDRCNIYAGNAVTSVGFYADYGASSTTAMFFSNTHISGNGTCLWAVKLDGAVLSLNNVWIQGNNGRCVNLANSTGTPGLFGTGTVYIDSNSSSDVLINFSFANGNSGYFSGCNVDGLFQDTGGTSGLIGSAPTRDTVLNLEPTVAGQLRFAAGLAHYHDFDDDEHVVVSRSSGDALTINTGNHGGAGALFLDSGSSNIYLIGTGDNPTVHLLNGNTNADQFITMGNGSPAGGLSAPVGSLYLRTDGGTSTTLYVKESGTGNTGWVAK